MFPLLKYAEITSNTSFLKLIILDSRLYNKVTIASNLSIVFNCSLEIVYSLFLATFKQ